MINRFYTWLRLTFLPEWARRSLVEENQRLERKLAQANKEIARLEAYIDGMNNTIRRQRPTIIMRGDSK